MRFSLLLPCLPALTLFSIQLGAQSSADLWARDLDYFATELPRRHPDLFFKTEEALFRRQIRELRLDLPGLEDHQVIIRLQEILARMGDAHTSIDIRPILKGPALPLFGLYWFRDGIYLLETTRAHLDLLGRRLVAVNGHPLDARLIGEATSGRPNHFGEVRRLFLPNQRVAVFYATKYFKTVDGDPPAVEPDVPVDLSFSEYMQGIDPAWEYIIQAQ